MKILRIYFTDFSSDFNIEEDIFYKWLSTKYQLIIDKSNPDYLIYSCYGDDYLKYKDAVRIFYTAENIRPDFNLCDYAIGFDYLEFGDRYIRFPNYARYGEQFEQLTAPKDFKQDFIDSKSGFCNFIYSNSFADPTRDQFFHLLNNKKKIDSLGKHLKNSELAIKNRYTSDWRNSKVDIQKSFKFSIAFENSFAPGYTTEKLMHAFIANTIPIYWGNPYVTKDFNPLSFINCHDYASLDNVIDRVLEIEQNNNEYLKMVNQPPFLNNLTPHNLERSTLLSFFQNIFEQPLDKAFRKPKYGTTFIYETKLLTLNQIEKRFSKVNSVINKIGRIW